MIAELWWLWATLCGITTGVMIYTNQICKMPSSLMMVYRGFFLFLFLTMFAVFFEAPKSPWFWVLGIIQGLIISYSDKKTFLCSRIFGGEITATIKPYAIAFIFIFWFVLKPQQLLDMFDDLPRFGTVVVCMLGVVLSLFMMKKKSVSNEAFKMLFPALICSVAIDINNKQITTIGSSVGLLNSIFWYCWITAFFSGIPNTIKFIKQRDWKLIFVPKYMFGGAVVALSVVAGNIAKNTAMFYADNPAYVSALIALYPVWIIIWNKFYYRHNGVEKFFDSDIRAVIVLLLSIILLILVQ